MSGERIPVSPQCISRSGCMDRERCREADRCLRPVVGHENMGSDHAAGHGVEVATEAGSPPVSAKAVEPDRSRLIDRVWIWPDELGSLYASVTRPPKADAVEYMRVLSRREVDKLAGDGVDVQQYINSLLRTIEGQRRHIARLNKDVTEAVRDAHTERNWQEKQRDEHGSY